MTTKAGSSSTSTPETIPVAHGTVVTIHYILRAEGSTEALENSHTSGEPFPYLHGFGNVVPGLEKALKGRLPGEKLTVMVAAEDAYGDYDETLKQSLPRSSFPPGTDFEKHSQFEAENEDGEFMILRVVSVDNDYITVDGNHELAGKNLSFDVEILSVRRATEIEIKHGHPHQEGSPCEH